jgi:cephalosporin hydroxylase
MESVTERRKKMDSWDVASLEEYVARRKDKDGVRLLEAGSQWLEVSVANKLSYEIEWLGVPIIQTPEDIVLMQELIFRIRPDYIIETGIAHGGSLVFYASLFEILGKGRVIGVDIDIREQNREVIEGHPLCKRIELIEGDSTSDEVIRKVEQLAPKEACTIVCLDSNHYREHVLKELMSYRKFVNPGSYIVVFDTVASRLVDSGVCDESFRDNGPMEAIGDFLEIDSDFVIDAEFNKLYVSTSHNGYLKRVR